MSDTETAAAAPAWTSRRRPASTIRPASRAIAYRVGAHAQFKRVAAGPALAAPSCPALAGLGARDDGDFTIALCDALATTLDVLAFYQERIANENYLRTATERRSILELARLIGYELAPGRGGLDLPRLHPSGGPGQPGAGGRSRSTIPVGAKVQSVPGPGGAAADFRDRRGGRGARRMECHSGADHFRLASAFRRHPALARRCGERAAAGRCDPDRGAGPARRYRQRALGHPPAERGDGGPGEPAHAAALERTAGQCHPAYRARGRRRYGLCVPPARRPVRPQCARSRG